MTAGSPYFTEVAGIDDEATLKAIAVAADTVIRATLSARLRLTAHGFRDTHPLCRELEETAGRFVHTATAARSVLRDR